MRRNKAGKDDKYFKRLELVSSCAKYIVSSGATIRSAAKKFHVSKSWLHHNIENLLYNENKKLYRDVRGVINKNKSERHIRGGMATKIKYMKNK